jgi:DNA-binding transcriptional MerR regulator
VDRGHSLTIDQLAAAGGTTTRRVRSFQTLGLLPHPELRGRTGLYGPTHQQRLLAILRLQDEGFSLESVGVLFRALEAGSSLAEVLGLAEPVVGLAGHRPPHAGEPGPDESELYGFGELQGPPGRERSRHVVGRPLLSVVPTTLWDENRAS